MGAHRFAASKIPGANAVLFRDARVLILENVSLISQLRGRVRDAHPRYAFLNLQGLPPPSPCVITLTVAQLLLDNADVLRLAAVLAGTRKPAGLRPGTWHRIVREHTLEELTLGELRALYFAYPSVLETLGLFMPHRP